MSAAGTLRGLKRFVFGAPAIYLAGSVLARVGSFVLLPIYTRHLDPVQYGDYTLALSIVTGVQTMLSALFLTGISRLYFDGSSSAEGHARAGVVARWFVCATWLALAGLLAASFAFGSDSGLGGRTELAMLAVAGAGSALATVPFMIMRQSQRPLAASLFNMGQFLTTAVSGVVLVASLQRGLRGAIEAMSISGAVNGLIAMVFIFVTFRGPMSLGTLRDAFRFTIPLFPSTIEAYVRSIVDRWSLKYFGLDAQLGEYGLANQLMTPASMVVSAWNDSEGPRVGEIYREKGVLGVAEKQHRLALGYFFSALVPAVGTALAAPILGHVVGKDFSNALLLLPFLGMTLIVETLYSPPLYVVYYASQPRLISAITLSTSVVGVACNIGLIPRFGVAGAIAARQLSAGLRLVLISVAAKASVKRERERQRTLG